VVINDSELPKRTLIRRVLIALLVILGTMSVIVWSPAAVAPTTGTLDVSLVPKPQLSSWLGFYDSIFPVEATVVVHNTADRVFPGGNLTGRVKAPSGQWQINLFYSVSSIPQGQSQTFNLNFQPQEPGVYIVTLNQIDIPLTMGTQEYWDVSGGFKAVQVESPSILLQAGEILLLSVLVVILLVIAGLLRRRTAARADPTKRFASSSALLETFKEFDAGKKIEEYLLREGHNKKFESAISWLLEILGFQTIKLDSEAQGENLSINGRHVGSADILAYDPCRDALLVVGCTIGVPDAAELQRIANTANGLRSEKRHCDPVVVTFRDAGLLKKEGKMKGVTVVDHTDLQTVVSLIDSGRLEKAKRIFE
jgi:hypothetical protein